MPVTADDIRKLRERHQRLDARRSEWNGRKEQLSRQEASVKERVKAEFGCDSLDELRELLTRERAELEAAYGEAERDIKAAEAALA